MFNLISGHFIAKHIASHGTCPSSLFPDPCTARYIAFKVKLSSFHLNMRSGRTSEHRPRTGFSFDLQIERPCLSWLPCCSLSASSLNRHLSHVYLHIIPHKHCCKEGEEEPSSRGSFELLTWILLGCNLTPLAKCNVTL